jgi:hypothetical protein
MIGIFAFSTFVGSASASLGDIPTDLSNALGIAVWQGELLLAIVLMMSVALPLAYWKVDTTAISIVLVGMLGFLTAIVWVDAWLLILAVIIFATQFGVRVAKVLANTGD